MSSQKYDPPLSSEVEIQPPITTAPSQANTPIAITTAPSQADTPTSTLPPGGWSSITCPPGLEYLLGLDYLFVNQKNTLVEDFPQWELPEDKYVITDNRDVLVFYIKQEPRTCWQVCCVNRSHEYITYGRNQQEILRMVRPFGGCCGLAVLEVYSGSTLLGSVTQEWSWRPKLYIRDASGQEVLMMKGRSPGTCSNDLIFEVKSLDEMHDVGVIQKRLRDVSLREVFLRERVNVSNKFDVNFPHDLDVKIKAVLLGAAILLDATYFGRHSGRR